MSSSAVARGAELTTPMRVLAVADAFEALAAAVAAGAAGTAARGGLASPA